MSLGSFNSIPMTLPPDVVGSIRETWADQCQEELQELREAVPEVMQRIQEEFLGQLDEAAGSSSSAARPAEPSNEAQVEEERPSQKVEVFRRSCSK